MDQIIIKDLEVSFHIGVPEEERVTPQRLLVTIEMESDFTGAAKDDDLCKTIDYHAVYVRLASLGRGRSWKLIETLAVEMAELVLRDFKPNQVSIEIKKFILPQTQCVAVRVVRPKKPA